MKYQRWDCSIDHPILSVDYTLLHEPMIVKHGYKEAAFLVALSSAGAAWSVARACAEGRLASCSCNIDQHVSNQAWQWGGCSYSVKFGLITSRKLLTPKHSSKTHDLMRKTYRHNLKAGRVAVKRTLRKTCKCHGMSGSCQIKTCWKTTADLRNIGTHLWRKMQTARFLLQNNSPNDSRHVVQKIRSSELVYFEQSPSFCDRIDAIKTLGTSGRTCNIRNETKSVGDCDLLCCGRGYYQYRETSIENCRCKFQWCCYVTCEKCRRTKWVSKCR
ncbi:unnamed protein product [Soboliphyme baturini]|uniref:Protein Wnt n=1 Tax=Soboliphyme baturini TaxID=241478 RepID=A0A183IP89_9BILA|nr:unnamed protein product [Soboliphyme baturini]